MHPYCCGKAVLNAAKKLNNLIYHKLKKLPVVFWQPVIKPGYAWCMAPDYLHKGNYIGFTKLLFQ